MTVLNKKFLSERDICTKFITPAIEKAQWDKQTQFLEEVYFTDGKIYVRGKLTKRGAKKRADENYYIQLGRLLELASRAHELFTRSKVD